MPVAFRSATTGITDHTGTGFVQNRPTGVAANDALIAAILTKFLGGPDHAAGGFTLFRTIRMCGKRSAPTTTTPWVTRPGGRLVLAYKIATASEPLKRYSFTARRHPPNGAARSWPYSGHGPAGADNWRWATDLQRSSPTAITTTESTWGVWSLRSRSSRRPREHGSPGDLRERWLLDVLHAERVPEPRGRTRSGTSGRLKHPWRCSGG